MASLVAYDSSEESDAGDNTQERSKDASEDSPNFFNLSDEEDCSDNSVNSLAKDEHFLREEKSTGCVKNPGDSVQIPSSDFWQKTQTGDDCSKIWPATERNLSEEFQSIAAPPKRPKLPNRPFYHGSKRFKEDGDVSRPSVCKPLDKKCFIVHCRIAPYLNSQVTKNHIPKRKLIPLAGHSKCVNQINWCQNQYSHLLLSASMDGTVKIWDVFSPQEQPVQVFDHHMKGVKQATWDSTGRQVLSASYDKTARVFDVEKGAELVRCEHQDFASCVQYHPVQSNLFIVGSNNRLLCWDQRNPAKPVRKYLYKDAFGQVQDICFLHSGQQFFSCSDQVCRDSADRNIMAWDFEKGVVLSNQIFQERYTCPRLKMHPREHLFVAQTQGNYVALFSTIAPYKMNKYKRFEGHTVLGYGIGCTFSPDGRLLASGSCDSHIHFYDFHLGKPVQQLRMNDIRNSVCTDVAWHPVLPSVIATASWGGSIDIWQ